MKKIIFILSFIFIFTQFSFAQDSKVVFELLVDEIQTELNGYQLSVNNIDIDPSVSAILQIPEGHRIDTVIPIMNNYVQGYSDMRYTRQWQEYDEGYTSFIFIDSTPNTVYFIWYVETSNRLLIALIEHEETSSI